MELTPKEIKFLTILNETRISDGRMFGKYLEKVNERFTFTNQELNAAAKKLVKMNLLTEMNIGGNEFVYFHTEKVDRSLLDKQLRQIKH